MIRGFGPADRDMTLPERFDEPLELRDVEPAVMRFKKSRFEEYLKPPE